MTAVFTRRPQISKTKETDAGKGNWDRDEVRHSREVSWKRLTHKAHSVRYLLQLFSEPISLKAP